MIPTLKYFWLTVKHRWFVFLAGLKVGVPLWRLITHDLSKFSWHELPHYGNRFFGKGDNPEGFIRAWLHHQNQTSNDHHWEYWIPRTGHNRCDPPYPDNKPIRMPYAAALEMVADWMGASRAYEKRWPTTGNWPWLEENFDKIVVHPETRMFLLETLKKLGFIRRIDLKNRWMARL